MNLIKLFLLAVTLFSVYANASKKGTGRGNEGGGGNTILGRPVEAYAKDITELSAYKGEIEKTISSLELKVPAFGKSLRDVTVNKIWYFVPVKLNTLESWITGLPLSSQQAVIHTKDNVWLDRNLFQSMKLEDQRTLLLHEIIMAVAFESYSFGMESLTHEQIRRLTIRLPKLAEKSPREIVNFINNHANLIRPDPTHYDTWKPGLNYNEYPNLPMTSFNPSGDSFYNLLKELSEWAPFFSPTHLTYSQYHNAKLFSCEITPSQRDERLYLEMKVTTYQRPDQDGLSRNFNTTYLLSISSENFSYKTKSPFGASYRMISDPFELNQKQFKLNLVLNAEISEHQHYGNEPRLYVNAGWEVYDCENSSQCKWRNLTGAEIRENKMFIPECEIRNYVRKQFRN